MASQDQVRQYLAYWFQLGKKVLIQNGQAALLPQPVIRGDRYSAEFEECWQQIVSPASKDCYLEGTHQTIAELLTSSWEISPCARCAMPVPVPNLGNACADLPLHRSADLADTEMPQPRSPINSQSQLIQIRDRLMQSGKRTSTEEE